MTAAIQPKLPTFDLVLDVREVARVLKCHPDTVYALIGSGPLRAKRLGKQRAIRVPIKALEAYLNGEGE